VIKNTNNIEEFKAHLMRGELKKIQKKNKNQKKVDILKKFDVQKYKVDTKSQYIIHK